MVAEDVLGLPPDVFRGLSVPRLYVKSDEFMSHGYPRQPTPWQFLKG